MKILAHDWCKNTSEIITQLEISILLLIMFCKRNSFILLCVSNENLTQWPFGIITQLEISFTI